MKDKVLKFLLEYWLYIISGLIIFSFCAPLIFTQFSIIDFRDTGQIGDTIGGIMNPFIGIAAVIVTGLAFYAQYKANDMVKKQFEIQKFENQFYEMLRLHKENVNEIEVKDSSEKIYKGRAAFLIMKNILFDLPWITTYTEFINAYKDFFWKEKNNYHSYLGHYYRHLFYMVKFVHKQDFLSEEKKLDYLRILRAQLSNYEQEMLFYNWLSGYGDAWENENNQFFTRYRMIHNLWYDRLYELDFIKDKLKNLIKKYKELGREDELFEMGDDIDEKFKIYKSNNYSK